eukprot:TRINITY_DN6956_c0_g1_i1.p1 TRINITY_DN6956_c0_g1~~TRINITY_DN6956_c0_g1_i1.p1  ORF type:complete len:106 (+),score=5.87 TRINITY_DN6956_c0_g1_i1:891-1208(+)
MVNDLLLESISELCLIWKREVTSNCFLLHCAFFLFYAMKLLLRSVQCIVVHAESYWEATKAWSGMFLLWGRHIYGNLFLLLFLHPFGKKRNNKIFELRYKPLEDT